MKNKDFAAEIRRAFEKRSIDAELFVMGEVDSTNTRAKLFAKESTSRRAAFFIAERQSAGRGRLGRSFLSRSGGMYFSYLAYPSLSAKYAVLLTAYTAVALSEVLSELVGLETGIKWVNDIFVKDKKLAGILTEGEFEDGGEHFRYAVVGVGLNVGRVDFGEELSSIATDIESETGKAYPIADIAAALAERLLAFESKDASQYMKKYRELSVLINRRVKLVGTDDGCFATVKDITEDGALRVVTDGGETRLLTSGDVSIRFN